MKKSLAVILALLSLTLLSSSGVQPGAHARRTQSPSPADPFTLLHSFAGGDTDGATPFSQVILNGTTLYGITNAGGTNDLGTVFSIGTDGNSLAVLHSFGAVAGDGRQPWAPLILSGSTLYGTTDYGGTANQGTIFKIDTNGGNYAVLHSFTASTSDGTNPGYGALVLSGSLLYGMTTAGGAHSLGTVYKYDLSGGTITLLHSFAGGTSDGSSPEGGLILVGSTLYGMTFNGGSSNAGTVFKVDTDGNNYLILHTFTSSSTDGGWPHDSLIADGTTLYGLTCQGGPSNWGALFAMGIDGSWFNVIHTFGGLTTNPGYPLGTPVLGGAKLYGLTAMGGANDDGTVFAINTNGTEFQLLHAFAGGTTDGSVPYHGAPVLSGSTLYGMTKESGASAKGTIFSYALSPDISLGLSPSNYNPNPYEEVTLYLNVSNNGLAAATGVEVTYQLPIELTYESNNPSQGSYDPGTGIWTIGTVAAGGSAELNLTAEVNSSGTILNTATKTAENETDSNTTNDQASMTLTTTPSKTLLVPILGTPASGATGMPTSVLLKWKDTNNTPQEMKYKVRIKKAGGIYANTTLPAGTISFNKTGLTPGKTYYWNVQAVGNGTSTKSSPWANSGHDFSFTVAPPVTLNPPTLSSPANNATGQPLSVSLQWLDTNSSPDEVHYKVRFKVAGGTYTMTTLGPGTTALVKSGLKAGKTYYWSVQAVGSGTALKNSAWPADFKFSTS